MLVSSVPLSETHVAGLPRIAMNGVERRATPAPESEVSATSAKRRPSVNVSETKSSDQRLLVRDGSADGARSPRARLRQPPFRTCRPSVVEPPEPLLVHC